MNNNNISTKFNNVERTTSSDVEELSKISFGIVDRIFENNRLLTIKNDVNIIKLEASKWWKKKDSLAIIFFTITRIKRYSRFLAKILL
ncbi:MULTISPECIES: hypothetical protein [unclassified Aureispira]|uniref:hypothetical protein n=1 Tax=unclassified Aureispira TaxID=2649989 RepID=UPI00069783C2|nr:MULTISPECIES: hypothetical protein [unclassified Aureispira]WMX17434.1 hypothetical protein QP953_13715 [Aureispira sp. CCB-E]